MPRRNRSRADAEPSSVRGGAPIRVETRRGRGYTVQPVDADRALKEYRCPGCSRPIEPGVAHLVVWRADGVLGDQADLDARRHWHQHCWRVA